MHFQKTLLAPMLIALLALGTSLSAQNWSYDQGSGKNNEYVLRTEKNTARMDRQYGDSTRWIMTLYFRDPPANVDPKIEFIHSDGSISTFNADRKQMKEGPSSVQGLTQMKFPYSPEMLEEFMSAKTLKFTLGRTYWSYPLSGARYAINYAEDIIEMGLEDQAEQEAYEALDHDSIRECDRLTAHPWDTESNTAKSSGVAWKDLDGAKGVVACKAALESDPTNARLKYHLARAYDKLGDARAFDLMQTAAQDDIYAAAQYHYGTFHENGEYTEKDLGKALTSYISGAVRRHVPSVYAKNRIIYKHARSDDERRRALGDIRWAAKQDYSFAIKFLEQLN